MEAHRSIGGNTQSRRPLADCTNTVSRTSQQSSSSSASIIKFANPSLTSSLKRLVDQTTLKEKIKDVNNSKANTGIASRSLSTSVRPVTRRMSTDLDFPAPTPSLSPITEEFSNSKAGSRSASKARPVTRRTSADFSFPGSAPSRPPESRSDRGVSGKEIAEPCSVYTVRRKASGTKRKKDASSSSSVARLCLDLLPNSGKKTNQANENKPKPSKGTPKKRQRTTKRKDADLAHGATQDYIEKQRAYFAEVDAFELSEEEVSSSDLD